MESNEIKIKDISSDCLKFIVYNPSFLIDNFNKSTSQILLPLPSIDFILDGLISIDMTFIFNNEQAFKKRDIDNLAKAIIDRIKGRLFIGDDNRVVKLTAYKALNCNIDSLVAITIKGQKKMQIFPSMRKRMKW